ncbi:MAG: patatin-like phospholipase family protein [Burkholderiales bacterium]|nr:patatin-like phospholipase family protein [Burkholderiales bacterium]
MAKRIAIACQGGGSHTAFTAGVLRTLLRDLNASYRIVGLSGTSGGAICALLAWYGLLRGDRKLGIELLQTFWTRNAANLPLDALANLALVSTSRLRGSIALPEISPYFFPETGRYQLKRLLEQLVPFAELPTLVHRDSPTLLIGAVEVRSGLFTVFREPRLRVEHILASAAVPNLFRAMHIDGEVYWDGLFSQNPPVREFLREVEDASDKPDEIWIVQINPQAIAAEPVRVQEIEDRRNELAGNLSLNQEIAFIERVNEWIAKGWLPAERFKPVIVRRIALGLDLDYASKLDRSPEFMARLIANGEAAARDFLKTA